MASLISIADGNASAASTWGVADATSLLDSEASNGYAGTSYLYSSVFAPGAITTPGVAVKINGRTAAASGTFTVQLYNDTDAVEVEAVTINVSDLASLLGLNQGWVFFKFASSHLLLAGKNYKIGAKTSAGSMVLLYRDGTTANWSRMLLTTTTAAPAANDLFHIMGHWTGAGARTNYNVNWDITATTSFGSTTPPQAITINGGGTLTGGTSASTAYYLKWKGVFQVFAGGLLNTGTVGSPMPATSSFELKMDVATNVDTGIVVSDLGSWVGRGNALTYVKAFLNANASAAATSLTTDVNTGWLSGDEIAIATTSRTYTECEKKTLSGPASGTTLPIAAITYAHSGTWPTQAEVGNLTRNVKISGTSATLQGYVSFTGNCAIDIEYCEFFWLGSNTTFKRGLSFSAVTAGATLNMQYCAIHDYIVASSLGFVHSGASLTSLNFSNNVIYNVASITVTIAAITTTSVTLDGNLAISPISQIVYQISDVGGTFINNTSAGGSQPFVISESAVITGTFSGNTFHGSNNVSQVLAVYGGTISNTKIWRCNIYGLQLTSGVSNLLFDGLEIFGCTTSSFNFGYCSNITFNNLVSSGDTSFSSVSGIGLNATNPILGMRFTNSTFGVVSGIKTAHTQDILCVANLLDIAFENCIFASATEVASQSLMLTNSEITSQRHDQTAGNHKTWKPGGTITLDSTIYSTASPSQRLTPLSASVKLQSGKFRTACNNGESLIVQVYVRESVVGDGADYNGNRIRLILLKNVAAGIAADTVLVTATISSEGAWQKLAGLTDVVTDDAILEFVVDCDGTTGWVNVDDWSCLSVADTRGLKYWKDGQPFAYGDNEAASSGTSLITNRARLPYTRPVHIRQQHHSLVLDSTAQVITSRRIVR